MTAAVAAVGFLVSVAIVFVDRNTIEWAIPYVGFALMIAGALYFPALFVLSLSAIWRGALKGGLFLMIGAPVLLYWLAFFAMRGLTDWSAKEDYRSKNGGREAHQVRPGEDYPMKGPLPKIVAEEVVALTDTAGKEMKARLVSLAGDTLTLSVDGKIREIKMDSLTPESQARVRERLGRN